MKVLPSPQAISRMEEVITWNRYLEREDANLLWARAEGLPWKEICHRFGISRPTAHRRHEYALARDRVAAQRAAGEPQARDELHDRASARLTSAIGRALRGRPSTVKNNRHRGEIFDDTRRPLTGKIFRAL